jgi:hypothetical protein
LVVRSHIGSERPELGPYKCMLTLTSKTRFGVMRGCQEQTREGDLGGSPGFGWTGRPKADNILLVKWSVTLVTPHLQDFVKKIKGEALGPWLFKEGIILFNG